MTGVEPLDRRRFLALLSMPAVGVLLHGCGSDRPDGEDDGDSDGASAGGIAQSAVAREAVCICDASVASDAVNGFGTDLLVHLLGSPSVPANVVVSPASIAIALAMTRAGAGGTTAAEMDAVLHVADVDLFPHSMNALQLGLTERSQQIDVPGRDEPAEISVGLANSLWGQQGHRFGAPFLDVLAAQYGAGMHLVDYRDDADGARRQINAWVADATDERITELLAEGVIAEDARLLLVDAMIVRAPWSTPFDEQLTADAPFTTAQGGRVTAAMMQQTGPVGFAESETWRAIELPYVGNLLSMLIVLPNEGSSELDCVAAIPTLAASSRSERVAVSLPRFDTGSSTALEDALTALGMPAAFDPRLADFSPMADPGINGEALVIGPVVHRADITVDESGTEAAAATAVVAIATSAPAGDPIDFVVDRPFLFALRDNPTGAVLVAGRIGDPTTGRS